MLSATYQPRLPSDFYGRGRAVLRRSERLWINFSENDTFSAKCRSVDRERVVVQWRSVVLPDFSSFFLPGIGPFLTGNLRPSFEPGIESVAVDEDAVRELACHGSGALLIAASFEASVRCTLSILADRTVAVSNVIERSVWVDQEVVPLRLALIRKWRTLVNVWLGVDPCVSVPADFDKVIRAMRVQQESSRVQRIDCCRRYVSESPMMDAIRELDGWEWRLGRALDEATDEQLEYLSECPFWGFMRLSTDAPAFSELRGE